LTPNFLKIILLFFGFWILALLETSFFSIISRHLHLVWTAAILINLFENRYSSLGFWSAAFGGFFLDIYSPLYFFGFNALILVAASFILKFIFLRYVELPISQKPKRF
jgi:hypothetical protein